MLPRKPSILLYDTITSSFYEFALLHITMLLNFFLFASKLLGLHAFDRLSRCWIQLCLWIHTVIGIVWSIMWSVRVYKSSTCFHSIGPTAFVHKLTDRIQRDNPTTSCIVHNCFVECDDAHRVPWNHIASNQIKR